eukprot:7412024-Karenia_brevis.AAC.1
MESPVLFEQVSFANAGIESTVLFDQSHPVPADHDKVGNESPAVIGKPQPVSAGHASLARLDAIAGHSSTIAKAGLVSPVLCEQVPILNAGRPPVLFGQSQPVPAGHAPPE